MDYSYTIVYPSFKVPLPITPDDWHKTIKIRATMDVVYADVKETAKAVNGYTYRVRRLTDATKHVELEYTFFIVSPDELVWRAQHEAWLKRDTGMLGFVFFQLWATSWLFLAFPQLVSSLIKKAIRKLTNRQC